MNYSILIPSFFNKKYSQNVFVCAEFPGTTNMDSVTILRLEHHLNTNITILRTKNYKKYSN